MTLLYPLFLTGLVLVVLPVAAHLLRRRAVRRVVVPSVELLLARVGASGERPRWWRWWRWRDSGLLLLRVLAVGLIVLAFAQPTLRGGGAMGFVSAAPLAAGGGGWGRG